LRKRAAHIAIGLPLLLLLAGCDPAKRVPEGQYLLKQNRLNIEEKSADPAELRAIIKQKPNKRILGMRFHLTMYNLPDPERIDGRRARKDARMDRRNERRVAKGKKPKPYKRTTGEWLRGSVGEAPVVLDPELTDRSSEQLRLHMRKEGWFRATVRDTVHFTHHRPLREGRGKPFRQRKAEVEYLIEPGPMYRYRNIRYTVDDPAIGEYVRQGWANSLLKPGDRFDADVLDRERGRINDRLRELGYLYFNRDLVQYDADTTVGTHEVDIVLRLERPYAKQKGLRGTPEGTVYTIGEVTIGIMPHARQARGAPMDTLHAAGYRILHQGRPPYKTQALLGAVFLRPDERFKQSNADRTYRRLTSLRVFDRVELAYDTANTGRPGLANARIDLLPGKEQSVSAEGFGTNRGGFLGTSVSLGYRHRNVFRGMGSLQAQVTLGLEAQQGFTGAGAETEEETTGGVASEGLFNTVDIGPEVTLRFPHFLLPVKRERFARSAAPSTSITTLYNLQQRPDFSRTLAKMSYGYEWSESRTKTWGVFPLEVNVIRIPKISREFGDYLRTANDPVLTDSYTDHLIAGMRGQFTHNTQALARRRNTFFSRIIGEWAGHPMLVPLHALGTEARDTAGNVFNTVAGIRYAEFVKLDSDLRWRHELNTKSSLAFRVAAGAGVPYGNLGVLPFETSFFVGGANGLRAWRARSIGPGSYSAPLLAFDRIGEIRLEGNAEYRFKLIGFLEGAFFADVGNIWNWEEDPRKPGAAISGDLLSELAVGTGMGARLNFDFFILRFDLGLQTKDPSLPPGERWLFQPKDRHLERLEELTGTAARYRAQFNFNLGIGYPF